MGAPVHDAPPATAGSIRGHHLFLEEQPSSAMGASQRAPLAQLCTVAKRGAAMGNVGEHDWGLAVCLQTAYILCTLPVKGEVLATLFLFSTPFKTIRTEPATVVRVCNSSEQEAEAGGWRV